MERTVTTYDSIGTGIARPRSRIGALWRVLVTAAEIRVTRRSLEALPDYLLKDMGIARSEIEMALRHGRHRSNRISAPSA